MSMKRRQFITLLGGAAAWPLAAGAQQPTMPMVGFVTGLSSNYVTGRKPAFRRGLREVGYVEGQNVLVEYHSVEGQSDLLSGVVTDLIERKVAVIVAVGGTDPVTSLTIKSLAQPSGTATKKGRCRCTAAQAVAAALLANGTGNTGTVSGPRPRLRSGRNSPHYSRCSALASHEPCRRVRIRAPSSAFSLSIG